MSVDIESAKFKRFVRHSKLYSPKEMDGYQPLPPTTKVVQAYWREFDEYDTETYEYVGDVFPVYMKFSIVDTETTNADEDVENTIVTLNVFAKLDTYNRCIESQITVESYFEDSINPETVIRCYTAAGYDLGPFSKRGVIPRIFDEKYFDQIDFQTGKYKNTGLNEHSLNSLCNNQYYKIRDSLNPNCVKQIVHTNNTFLSDFYDNLNEKLLDMQYIKEFSTLNKGLIPLRCQALLSIISKMSTLKFLC